MPFWPPRTALCRLVAEHLSTALVDEARDAVLRVALEHAGATLDTDDPVSMQTFVDGALAQSVWSRLGGRGDVLMQQLHDALAPLVGRARRERSTLRPPPPAALPTAPPPAAATSAISVAVLHPHAGTRETILAALHLLGWRALAIESAAELWPHAVNARVDVVIVPSDLPAIEARGVSDCVNGGPKVIDVVVWPIVDSGDSHRWGAAIPNARLLARPDVTELAETLVALTPRDPNSASGVREAIGGSGAPNARRGGAAPS